MLKWTVQQKRQRASVIVDDVHEPADTPTTTTAAADCSGCGGGSCNASSGSECGSLGEEHQQQVMVTVTPNDGCGAGIPGQQCPSGPQTPTLLVTRPASCILPRCGTPSPTETEAPDADRAGTATEATTCDADDVEPAAAAFVRRASVRQPKARLARPLSLNLDTLYSCDRGAIPQKAKALLGIDERPRTPVVVAVTTAAGLVDRLTTVSPKAMAVLGLTAAESQHAVELQQQEQSRQRLSKLRRRREPASSRQLQQISECAAACTPVDESSPGAATGSGRGITDGWGGGSSSSNSGSTSDGCASSGDSGQMPPAATAAYGLAGDGDKASEQQGATAVVAAALQPSLDHRCALRCGPGSPGGTIVAAPRHSLTRVECLNEVAEMMAARPKVARRRPLKQHSRKEVLTKSVSSAAPRTATTSEPLGADDDADEGCGGSGACGSKPAARRCGSCTPDSGVGGLNGQSAEPDSPSEDDAIAAWKQPSPVTSTSGGPLAGGGSGSYGVGRHSPLPLPLRALCSPPGGALCDFIDIDILLGAGGPAAKPLPDGSCHLYGSGFGGSGYSSPTPDDYHRQPPQQRRQRAVVSGSGTPLPLPIPSPRGSGELRHAHSDPVSWASSSAAVSATPAMGEVPCALERESMRWAAMRASSGHYHLQTANGRTGRSAQGHSAERKAAIAAFRKTVHVYC